MDKKLNATCPICGNRYHVCGDCKKTREFTPWRTIADSINCYKICMALSGYTSGNTEKEKTRELLEQCDLSEKNRFLPEIQNTIENILKETRGLTE